MSVYNYLLNFLEKGTQHSSCDKNKSLTRILNAFFLGLFTLVFPLVVTYNVLIKDYSELVLLVILITITLFLLRLNQKGESQKAMIIGSLAGLTSVFPLAYLNNSKIGVTFLALLLSLVSIVFIKNKLWRNFIFIYGFVVFVVTDMYQLMYTSFNLTEHLISIVFVFLVFSVFKYVAYLQNKYEVLLKIKNNKIQDQSNQIIKIQEEKHMQELKIKQKDLEMLVASNTAQLKVKENILLKLKRLNKGLKTEDDLKNIMLELKLQVEAQKKKLIIQDNIKDVNEDFYAKIFEIAPSISNTEKELCIYIKLGLPTKEIALLKNTSPNTINVAKTRLRHKLGLNSNKEIATFLRGL